MHFGFSKGVDISFSLQATIYLASGVPISFMTFHDISNLENIATCVGLVSLRNVTT